MSSYGRGVESLSAKSGAFGRPDSRCGLYVRHFDDGNEYVGQARDVFTRFRTHVTFAMPWGLSRQHHRFALTWGTGCRRGGTSGMSPTVKRS